MQLSSEPNKLHRLLFEPSWLLHQIPSESHIYSVHLNYFSPIRWTIRIFYAYFIETLVTNIEYNDNLILNDL